MESYPNKSRMSYLSRYIVLLKYAVPEGESGSPDLVQSEHLGSELIPLPNRLQDE